MKREIERRIGGSVLLALLSLIKFVSEYLSCKTKEAHIPRIVLGATMLILIVSNISVAASVKIDSELLTKIDQYAIDGYSSSWDITLDQYKAWVLAIAQGEGSRGGYTAHSQGIAGSDLFYHKDLSKFTFSTGIGPFQVDRGGYSNPPWEKWSTIDKLDVKKSLDSTLLWHKSRFPGKGATLYDFAKKSAWFAVKADYCGKKPSFTKEQCIEAYGVGAWIG
ncbi:hypothetical protein KKB43_06820 [Patescibacteria group bacterium]|nr:hypothetical protein [Patescibacteria group bacterium]MBU4580691.1 hypothetical protein [Patescibacteria group bacterium]